jgi:hypothetical protein
MQRSRSPGLGLKYITGGLTLAGAVRVALSPLVERPGRLLPKGTMPLPLPDGACFNAVERYVQDFLLLSKRKHAIIPVGNLKVGFSMKENQ